MNTHTVKPEQLIVTHANDLATAAYSMTLEEKRLVLLLASMIRKDDDYFKCYRFPAKDVLSFLGLSSNNDAYNRIREITRKLLSRVVDIDAKKYADNVPAKKRRWKQFQWMAYASYIPEDETESGYAEIELQAHSQMRPYLLELKERFSSIPFAEIAQLPSYHSMRMFEILWAKSHQLKYAKFSIELEELKKMLGIEKKYSNFNDFKRFVLEKAKQDLAKKTPISFTYLTKKKGRRVTGIEFNVTAHKRNLQLGLRLAHTLNVTELPPYAETKNLQKERDQLFERMVDYFQFKQERAEELLASYSNEHVARNLSYADSQYKSGKVKHLTAYATKAIVQNYRSKDQELKQKESDSESIEGLYNNARARFIDEAIEEFGYKELLEEFEPQLLKLCATNKFLASQFKTIDNDVSLIKKNPVINSNFRQFVIDSYAPPHYQNLEEWNSNQEVMISN